jgi:hypothetical protein
VHGSWQAGAVQHDILASSSRDRPREPIIELAIPRRLFKALPCCSQSVHAAALLYRVNGIGASLLFLDLPEGK